MLDRVDAEVGFEGHAGFQHFGGTSWVVEDADGGGARFVVELPGGNPLDRSAGPGPDRHAVVTPSLP